MPFLDCLAVAVAGCFGAVARILLEKLLPVELASWPAYFNSCLLVAPI